MQKHDHDVLNAVFPFTLSVMRIFLLFLVVLSAVPRLRGDTTDVTPLGRGIYLKHLQYDNLYGSSQRILVVDADLQTPGITIKFPHLTGGARATVSTFAANTPGALALVNAQFFNSSGSIQFLKVDGKIVNATHSASVHDQQAITMDSNGSIDIALRPASGWASLTGIPNIMASGSALVTNGKKVIFDPADAAYAQRAPRTCVAITRDRHLLLVVVDGRSRLASGQTGAELQDTLMKLGPVINAFNLDGGGSSTLWAAGSVVNRPSGNEQRPVVNAIALFGAAIPTRVQNIVVSRGEDAKSTRPRALVTVVDAAGVPVPGATVTGEWSGAATDIEHFGTSDENGTATILRTSSSMRRTFFKIKHISGPNVLYDAAANVVSQAELPDIAPPADR